MALVIKVGEKSEMPPVPKNFPTCGNYLPEHEEFLNLNSTKCGEPKNLLKRIETFFVGEENCDDEVIKTSSSSGEVMQTKVIALISLLALSLFI